MLPHPGLPRAWNAAARACLVQIPYSLVMLLTGVFLVPASPGLMVAGLASVLGASCVSCKLCGLKKASMCWWCDAPRPAYCPPCRRVSLTRAVALAPAGCGCRSYRFAA